MLYRRPAPLFADPSHLAKLKPSCHRFKEGSMDSLKRATFRPIEISRYFSGSCRYDPSDYRPARYVTLPLPSCLKLDMTTVREHSSTQKKVHIPETALSRAMAHRETRLELVNSFLDDGLLDAPRDFPSLGNSFNARSFVAC